MLTQANSRLTVDEESITMVLGDQRRDIYTIAVRRNVASYTLMSDHLSLLLLVFHTFIHAFHLFMHSCNILSIFVYIASTSSP